MSTQITTGKVRFSYSTLEKAQAFVESRSDRPQQVSPYLYRTADFTDYLIYEVNIV